MRILFLGEIVGKGGVFVIKNMLAGLQKEHNIDFTIANGNAVTGGFGLGKNHALYLRKLGINTLIGGDYIFFKKDLAADLSKTSFVLRPANLPPQASGRGFASYAVGQKRIGVINMQGQSNCGRAHPSNPFTYTPEIIARMQNDNDAIVVTFHALATAEKQTLARHLAGKASAVIGYGGRALAADAQIIGGTAFITDCGRVGSKLSAGGFEPEQEIERLMSQRPVRSSEAWAGLELQGVIIETDEAGQALSIEALRLSCTVQPPAEEKKPPA